VGERFSYNPPVPPDTNKLSEVIQPTTFLFGTGTISLPIIPMIRSPPSPNPPHATFYESAWRGTFLSLTSATPSSRWLALRRVFFSARAYVFPTFKFRGHIHAFSPAIGSTILSPSLLLYAHLSTISPDQKYLAPGSH